MLQHRVIHYRYMDPKTPVYVLTTPRRAPVALTQLCVYTVPYQGNDMEEKVNVMVGFESKDLLQGYAKELNMVGHIEVGPLELWKDVSRMMHIPIVVVSNEYSDLVDQQLHGELFFFRTRDPHEDVFLTRKMNM